MRKAVFILLSFCTLYGMGLDEAISTALERSPVLKIQKLAHESSKEKRRGQRASMYGKFSAVGSYTKYNLPRTLAPIVPPITPDVVSSREIGSLGVRYDVSLFSGFSELRSVEIAELSERAASFDVGLGREELIYNVKSLFYKILSLKKRLESAKSYESALKRLHSDVQKGVDAGSRARVDLMKVSADLSGAEYTITEIENSISTLKAKLAALMGVDSVGDLEYDGEEESLEDADIKKSYRYKKAAAELKKSGKGVEKAISAYYPRLSLNAYYGDNYGSGEMEEIWQAGITLSWPIFDFGTRGAKLEEARIAKQIASLKLENEKLLLGSQVEDAKNRIESAKAKVASTKEELAFLLKIESAERVKYEKGASDMYDLLYAVAKVEKARSALAEAMYDLRIQKAYLNYITAGE